METPYDTSSYELTLEPLRGQLISRGFTEEPDLTHYNNLYVRPPEKLSHFENYVKNRLESNSLWEIEEEKKKTKPFIRKAKFTPFMANVDFSKSKFDHESSDIHQNSTIQDGTNIEVEEAATPRGLITSFLKKDPTEKIKSNRNYSADKAVHRDPKRFFFARPPSSKKENISPDANKNDSTRIEKTDESQPKEKRNRKKESIVSNSYLDVTATKGNDSTRIAKGSRVIIDF